MPGPDRERIPPAVAVGGTFALVGLAIASFFPFFSLYLSDRGLTPSDIGVVLAVMAMGRIATNPVWGSLADSRLGRRRVVQFGLLGESVATLILSMTGHGTARVIAPALLMACFGGQMGPNVDAFALAHLGEQGMSRYGRIRAVESLAYAVGCISFGLFLQAMGVSWLQVLHAGALLAALAWSRTLVADRPERRAPHGRLGTVGEVFRAAPRFWGYLAGTLLLWTGFNSAWSFLALRIESRGGGPLVIGVGAAAGGLVEVGVMLMTARLIPRAGLRTVYLIGAFVYAAAFLSWGLVTSALVVSMLTMLEGFGFALLYTSSVLIVGTLVPKHLYSTGQSLSSTVGFGLGPMVGGALGGWVFQALGPTTLYVSASILAACGGVIVWASMSGEAFRRPPVERPVTIPPGQAGLP
jgi:MFS transporter, PPP family, 3-phenylpropionic acid transporter